VAHPQHAPLDRAPRPVHHTRYRRIGCRHRGRRRWPADQRAAARRGRARACR
jgi:hypothetical protein